MDKITFAQKARQLYHGGYRMGTHIPNYHLIKKVVAGEMDTSRFIKRIGLDESASDVRDVINWKPVSVVAKHRKTLIGRLLKQPRQVSVTPIDEQSKQDEKKFFSQLSAKLMLQEKLKSKGFNTPTPTKADEPASLDELAILMEGGYKHRIAQEYEDILTFILRYNGFDPDIKKEVLSDMIDFGIACVREYTDSQGNIIVRHVPLDNLYVPHVSNKYFRFITNVGESMQMPLLRLMEMTPLNTIEIQQLNKVASRKNTLPSVINTENNEKIVEVFYFETIEHENIFVEQRTTSFGAEVVRLSKERRKSRTVGTIQKAVVWKGYWVVGTDVVIGLKKEPYQKHRNTIDWNKSGLSYHIRAAMIVNNKPVGLTSHCLSHNDMYHLAYYKLQHAIHSLRDTGLFVNLDAITDIPLGKDGQSLRPRDILSLFASKNILVGRTMDDSGRSMSGVPAFPIELSSGNALVQSLKVMEEEEDKIRSIYGLNALTDASTPNPKTLTTVAKAAMEGTNNSVELYISAVKSLLTELYNALAIRASVVIRSNSPASKRMQAAIGLHSRFLIRNSKHFSLYDVALTIDDDVDADEVRALEEAMLAAVREGSVQPEDIVFVRSVKDASKAADILRIRIAKNKRKALEAQRENMTLQAQINEQNARAAADIETEKIWEKAKAEVFVETEKHKLQQGVKNE